MKLVTKKKKKNAGNFAGDGDGGDNVVVPAGESCRNSDAGKNGEGKVVVVGVRLDQQSKELLTWGLVKVAQPGDRVIALHFLHSSHEEQSTLLSLVKSFDSVLAAYQGFCHLKQVELKLKVCRGSSLRKILVRETKAFNSATLILGTFKAHHSIRSPASVAKYCARKLPHNIPVFAVDNGKVVFHRKPAPLVSGNDNSYKLISRSSVDNAEGFGNENFPIEAVESDQESCDGFDSVGFGARKSTLIKRYFSCALISAWMDYPCDEMVEKSHSRDTQDSSLALVTYQPKPIVDQDFHESRPGWPLLRRAYLPKRHHEQYKVPYRKSSLVRRILRLPSRHSSMAVHPDGKKGNSCQVDDHASNLSAESGAIVAVGDGTSSVPSTPVLRLTHLANDQPSNLDGDGGAIVPVWDSEPCMPSSPVRGLKCLPKELEGLHEKYSATCRLFTYEELLSATSNFTPEKMIGKGGSSQVYRGCLPDGKELGVKILKQSEDVLQEFIAEIEIITTINHKNIISLVGYCFEAEHLILVYDFLLRGSLEENVHGDKKDRKTFGWEERYNVAVGVAEALDYLHNRDSHSVIHRDIKSSNILLSDDFEPQLADFGLATWASSVSSIIAFSDVAGTFGYLAPEYFMHGKVTDKMDVYAFGVVLLELLSGRKPIDNKNPRGKESLVIWANSALKGDKVSQLLDPNMDSNYNSEQIERMVLAATLCIRREPLMRPRIGNVLKLLQGDVEVIEWAKQQVNSYPADMDALDGESPRSDIQSHLNMALLDIAEDDSVSFSSTEQNISLEDYLRGRWSRSSSFD